MYHLEYYIVYYDNRDKRMVTKNYLTLKEAEEARQRIKEKCLWNIEPKIYEYRY